MFFLPRWRWYLHDQRWIYNVKSWSSDLIQMGECLFCNWKISHTVAPVWWLAVEAWTFQASCKNQHHNLATLQCKNSIHIPLNKVINLSDNYWLPLPVHPFTAQTCLPPKWQIIVVTWNTEPAHDQLTSTVLNIPITYVAASQTLNLFCEIINFCTRSATNVTWSFSFSSVIHPQHLLCCKIIWYVTMEYLTKSFLLLDSYSFPSHFIRTDNKKFIQQLKMSKYR